MVLLTLKKLITLLGALNYNDMFTTFDMATLLLGGIPHA